jgi:hypothetical protein
MHDDDEFLLKIPPFLRRCQEPPPRKLPTRPRDLPKAAPAATTTEAPKPAPMPATVTEAPKKPAAPAAPAAQRARIALAFENPDIPETRDLTEGKDGDDITFRITLPRGVVRQICMLAVERDTTQRAVVLRALRLAGLSIPDSSDIDRRAKRQA